MKFSEQWLREWVDINITIQQLAEKLTAVGLEVESIESVGDDHVIELGLTPNRGDCLSIRGIAREVAVITGLSLRDSFFSSSLRGSFFSPSLRGSQSEPKQSIESGLLRPDGLAMTNKNAFLAMTGNSSLATTDALTITIQSPNACPRYCGRIIKNVKADAPTPEHIRKRLEKAGVNSVSIIVDITNYVMLELGQPLHAFDLDKLQGNITVRMSENEEVELLNGVKVKLGKNTLVICDDQKVVAAAGVMGALNSEVSETTRNIFIESAYFNPVAVAGKARQFVINSDGSQRFERGVDFELPRPTLEYVTELILEYAGGKAGIISESISPIDLPTRKPIRLSQHRLNNLLGIDIPVNTISDILKRLGMKVEQTSTEFIVTPPSHRFDINIAEDLIEEVARIHGYNTITEQPLPAKPNKTPSESSVSVGTIKQTLIDAGYHEVITYSFVDERLQQRMFPNDIAQKLLNPISQDMNVMRVSIWPGLLQTFIYNQNRQQADMRIFEIGQCFIQGQDGLGQIDKLAGLIAGQCYPLHWKLPKRAVDFFDAKGDMQRLLLLANISNAEFRAAEHHCLHPGQTAHIIHEDEVIGVIGALHPALLKELGLKGPVFLYEITLSSILRRHLPHYQPVSKFPAIRRDLALVVDNTVTADAIIQCIRAKAGVLLTQIEIFDLYEGQTIGEGKKSIALGLILQDFSHTLIDVEVNTLMQAVIADLQKNLQATVRE